MKSAVSKPATKFGNEASRRLYRGAVEIARKLEQHLSIASSLTELFSPEIIELRKRLKEYCERLIFTDPVDFGKKAEDLLWRKVFYDYFFKCKQNRMQLLESEFHRSALINHLLAGIGFYHHLLLRIQTEYHINLEGKVDVPLLWHLKGVKKERWKKYQQSGASEDNIRNWANQACHRILIYLGDLERYIAELNEIESNHLAERYYLQAFCINSKNGTPHNQLGSLYSNRFDAAYHYMRCLACHDKFDGAEGNLLRVLERNEDMLDQLYSPEYVMNESMKSSRFLCRFLKLCQMFYFKPCENYGSEIYCQDILKEFNITLNSTSCSQISVMEEAPTYLTEDMAFKVIVMSLMCVCKLQEKGNSDASVAIAFCLALFSYVVDKSAKLLMLSLTNLNKENALHIPCVKDKQNPIAHQHVITNGSHNDNSTKEIKDVYSKKTVGKKSGLKKLSARHLKTLRRRRKMSSTSQEDSELSEGEMMDLPESDEESGLLNSDASRAGSCSSESLSEIEDEILEEADVFENSEKKVQIESTEQDDHTSSENNFNGKNHIANGHEISHIYIVQNFLDNPLVSPEQVIQIIKKIRFLPCLKILTDWLRINEEILSACAETSQLLLSRIIELLNILLKVEDKLLTTKDHLHRLPQHGETWKQVYPLPEDIDLQGFPLLKEVHSSLSLEISKRRKLSPSSLIFLRVQCLLQFGRYLVKASEHSIDLDSEKKIYYFRLCNKVKESNKSEIQTPKPDKKNVENHKQKLMKSMAHLWLKAEVNDLETLVEGSAAPQLSPYLVADASVLCSHLSAIKQLVNAKQFIIIVPLVVIASLDQLKKESIGAREAIRWLELELKKGCRYIRAQRQMEKISLVPMKYPRKKEKEAWDFFQILECCNYLVQQQTSGKKSDCSLVTLLVGSTHHLPENANGLAQSIDVSIEKLESLLSKWRNSSKKPG